MIPLAILANWTVSDPNGRLVSPPVDLGNGLWEFVVSGGWTSTDPASAVVIWMPMRDDDGVAVSLDDLDVTDVLQVADETPLPSTGGMVVAAGWSTTPGPTTSASRYKLAALRAYNATRYVQFLRNDPLTGAPVAPTWNLDAGPRARIVRAKNTGRQGMSFLACDVVDGALVATALANGSYLNNVVAYPQGLYRMILIGRSTTDMQRRVRIRVRAGLDRPTAAPAAWGAQLRGKPLEVAVLGDSLWCGANTSTPWLRRAVEAFLARSGWSTWMRPIRWRAHNTRNTECPHMLSGRANGDDIPGQTASSVAPVAASWAAIPGVSLDVVLIADGANDVGDGRTDDQILADRATIAAAYRAAHPLARLIAVAPRALPSGTLDPLRARILAREETWADDVVEWNDYPATALASDGIHPTLPPGNLDDPATWDGPFNFETQGIPRLAYDVAKALCGEAPPLVAGEVAP